ncbi:DegT/DnrJ/EryC1/StrS family aminotransferase [Pseudodesulfovibrio sp. zrk46]|uniref:DegT/DnrJ/EryC1/StrS family aminotransferase n=1 Tax=Pseudodesulfovibrio sp. zrk46 TaxID=2725288 RepID=UPI00144913C0|nr:DegT/DnrJ/EryC1/StrS family aminotransferase [Pseudodesulfovibrio sp. zrk46]QJB56263.1 DegT/DnrJ/EryC1/StrS family aminotransferase [Pseudodesulfovibrio sp. zrk46]
MPVRSKDNFLVFGAPRIEQAEIDEVVASMETGWLGTGPKVAQFEKDFSTYLGSGHAAACNSCTAALHLALVALGLKPGDEVITTPLTFCASVNAIIHAGCTPVLADVDPVTMNIDPEAIRQKITPRTKAILPVHFAGRPCNMDAIMAIAEEHDLKVVEDCAHAIETTYKGQHAGTFGDFGCFSFYVTKNVCTGEGGMVMARTPEDIQNIKVLGLHGMSADAWKRFSDEGYKHYQVVHAGFKYNMMDIQAAIGIHQLKRVEEYFVRRCEIWDMYQEAFKPLPVGTPAEEEANTRHARHLYTIMIDPVYCGIDRDEFLMRMNKQNIGCGVHYLSIPEHPYYQERFGWKLEDTPQAVALGRQTVSLPLSAKLTDDDVADVIKAAKICLGI